MQTRIRELRESPYLIEPMMGHVGHDVTSIHYDRPLAEEYAGVMAEAYRAHPFDHTWDKLGL